MDRFDGCKPLGNLEQSGKLSGRIGKDTSLNSPVIKAEQPG